MSILLQDLQYGIRLLVRTPAFTLTAALSLALGIGANRTIVTLVKCGPAAPAAGGAAVAARLGVHGRHPQRGPVRRVHTDLRPELPRLPRQEWVFSAMTAASG